jgi:hypothetical protein
MSTGDKDVATNQNEIKGLDSARRSVDHSRLFHQEQLPAYALKVVNNNNTSFHLRTSNMNSELRL